jgi:hypothetical protein
MHNSRTEWQTLTLDFAGPSASELGGQSNPFLDWRLNVTFTHLETGTTYTVPGFSAGDNDTVLRTQYIPEPTSAALLGTACTVLLLTQERKRCFLRRYRPVARWSCLRRFVK